MCVCVCLCVCVCVRVCVLECLHACLHTQGYTRDNDNCCKCVAIGRASLAQLFKIKLD